MKKTRKKQIKKLLSILIPLCIVLFLILIFYFSFTLLKHEKKKKFLETIETSTYANITNYAIYGIHFNISGNFTLPENVKDINLVLSNGENETNLAWVLNETESNSYNFTTSNYINDGLNLETLTTGEYYLLIKTTNTNEKNETETKYYSLENNSIYKNLEYYSLTKKGKNNKIDIEWNTYDEMPTLKFTIKETTLPDNVYDITIDPGHDVTDSGTTGCTDGSMPNSIGYCNSGETILENDMNLEVAKLVKEKLENLGYKVIMTRNTSSDKVEIYNHMGSATMANDTKSKFNLAIHHNASGFGTVEGLEIYIANDTDIKLAQSFVKNITNNAKAKTSTKAKYQINDGIYQRFFTEEEIADDDVQPSNKTTNTIYYYYIREVGGVSTHATNDGRYSPTYPKNEHYNSNNTAEPYLFELGYLDNYNDLHNLLNNREGYAEGIAQTIKDYLNS